MSANEKGLPQAPAQGQQSLYPNPQPPSYEESTRPEPWTVALQPVAQQSVPFGCISAIPMTQPSVPVVQHIFAAQPAVGPNPSMITCSSCGNNVLTQIEYKASTKTHVIAGLLCCFICWPFAWVPYVVDSCKNANHYCPSCGAYIGKYKQ